jgi:uncharacterized protein (TIGR03000 family)
MYSMILLLAIGPSGDAPAWGNRGCSGCYGSYSCCGGGYASYGSSYSCCGGGYASGCWGGRWGHGCNGCHGSYGSGVYGGVGCYGCSGTAPGMAAPRGAEMVAPPKGAAMPMAAGPAPATLLVHLPEDATLTLNAVPMTQFSTDTRRFYSPPLEPGRDYFYQVQAQIVRGGQNVVLTRGVIVRAGQETEVNLTIPGAALTQR